MEGSGQTAYKTAVISAMVEFMVSYLTMTTMGEFKEWPDFF